MLEAVSKPCLRFEVKTHADEKAQPIQIIGKHFEEAGNTEIGP